MPIQITKSTNGDGTYLVSDPAAGTKSSMGSSEELQRWLGSSSNGLNGDQAKELALQAGVEYIPGYQIPQAAPTQYEIDSKSMTPAQLTAKYDAGSVGAPTFGTPEYEAMVKSEAAKDAAARAAASAPSTPAPNFNQTNVDYSKNNPYGLGPNTSGPNGVMTDGQGFVIKGNPTTTPAGGTAPGTTTTTGAAPTAPPGAPAGTVTPGAPGTAAVVTAPVLDTQGQLLQVGSKGLAVSTLQGLLGIKTDGDFGPKTQAAVKAFQAANGLVVDGIVGPKTLAALNKTKGSVNPTGTVAAGATDSSVITPTTGRPEVDALISAFNNQSPQKSFADVYKEIYDTLGLSSMKANYEKETKAFSDLQNEKNDEKEKINNNPWYSEGVRVQKLNQLDKKYEGRENILTGKLKLLESNISNGRADAQFMAGQVMDQLQQTRKLNEEIIMKAIDVAEKKAEAEAKAKTSSTTSPKPTVAVTLGAFADAFDKSKNYGDSKGGPVIDQNGFVTPVAWKELLTQAIQKGITRANFIKQYGSYLYPQDLKAYGLTAPEMKLVTGSTTSSGRQL